jgi:hypothetical protein
VLRFETPAEGVASLAHVLGGEAVALREAGRELVEAGFAQTAAIRRMRELIAGVLAAR